MTKTAYDTSSLWPLDAAPAAKTRRHANPAKGRVSALDTDRTPGKAFVLSTSCPRNDERCSVLTKLGPASVISKVKRFFGSNPGSICAVCRRLLKQMAVKRTVAKQPLSAWPQR